MTDANPCPLCERPLPEDAFVCRPCTDDARQQLATIADLLDHADERRARRGSTWNIGTTGRSPEAPLPYDPRVTNAIDAITNRLTGWAREVEEATGDPWPGDPAALTRWLADAMPWTARQEWAGDAAREVRHAHDRVTRVFDNPPERFPLGRCGAVHDDGNTCPEVLSAPARDGWHKCPRCGTQHDVRERRAHMLTAAEDLHVTVAEAVRLLRLAGHNIDRRTVRALVRQVPIPGRGAQVQRDIKGRRRHVDTYPLGAIRSAVEQLGYDRDMQREVRRLVRGGGVAV